MADIFAKRFKGNTYFKIAQFLEDIMETKKEKRPTKKGLIGEIESLDTNKKFNLLSLTRTNIDNLITIRDLLKGGVQ